MTRKERFGRRMSSLPTLEHLWSGWRRGGSWSPSSGSVMRSLLDSSGAGTGDTRYPIRTACGRRLLRIGRGRGERQVVITALDMIEDDRPLSQVSDELNRRGHTNKRDGVPWTPTALFVLLPRMNRDWSEAVYESRLV
jgi:hypothetical protein